MKNSAAIVWLVLTFATTVPTAGQALEQVRDDQLNRLKQFILDAIQPSGLVRDTLKTDPNRPHVHPASPDAAAFAVVGLCGLHHVGKCENAQTLVERILSAYAGKTPGVTPARSADGHFMHFIDLANGSPVGGRWRDAYSPISSALLVTSAKFAHRHFPASVKIATFAKQLTESVNFNAAINPRLDGSIFLDMTAAGGGDTKRLTRPWNEFTLIVSHALREPKNDRARAIQHLWMDPEQLRKQAYDGIETLTDVPGEFRPAFLVQQGHFLNGDFRLNPALEKFYTNQQQADRRYSTSKQGLKQSYRYGLTAGVVPRPERDGYHADAIKNHPGNVFSPEAVAAWGDLETLLKFHADQNPNSDPPYRYGLLRVSALQPDWVPSGTALVDHVFLLFGLVESIDPEFFTKRMDSPWSQKSSNP